MLTRRRLDALPGIESVGSISQSLAALDGEPSTYRRSAGEYYEQEIDLGAVEHIYAREPLTDEVVRALNPDVSLADLKADVEEIRLSRPRGPKR